MRKRVRAAVQVKILDIWCGIFCISRHIRTRTHTQAHTHTLPLHVLRVYPFAWVLCKPLAATVALWAAVNFNLPLPHKKHKLFFFSLALSLFFSQSDSLLFPLSLFINLSSSLCVALLSLSLFLLIKQNLLFASNLFLNITRSKKVGNKICKTF